MNTYTPVIDHMLVTHYYKPIYYKTLIFNAAIITTNGDSVGKKSNFEAWHLKKLSVTVFLVLRYF